MNFTIKKSAGSEAIDIESMTVQYTSNTEDVTLVYNETNDAATWEDAADASNFTTLGVDGYSDDSLTTSEQRITLTVDSEAIEGDNGLDVGQDVTIKLVDQSGAQYTYSVSVPSTFGNKKIGEV